MSHSYNQDTFVGLFVAAGIAALFFMALQISNLGTYNSQESYKVIARFTNTGGLKVKSPVSVAGVRVGRVVSIQLDKQTFDSIVEIQIESQYDTLPSDTSAGIYTAGLLGEQYINLEPGGAEDVLANNSVIEITQPAIVLEEIISQALFKDRDVGESS